jgi:hydrogenase/urease accessory protein HupE
MLTGDRVRGLSAAALATAVALIAPAAAHAHGLSVDDDPNRALIQYVILGFEHMALGWDHLLFIIGMVLLAPNAKTAAKLVSLFVVGHSLTLLVATLAGWQVSPLAVDVVIALSVVYVGVLGVLGGPKDWRLTSFIVFAFGLIHGLGLATRLQDIALPEDGLVIRILLFNVGLELGQLSVLLVVVALWKLLTRAVPRALNVQRIAFGAMVLAGLGGAVMLTAFAEDESQAEAAAGCSESPRRSSVTAGQSHPPKRWYGPDEEAPVSLFNHILFDGYVVVTYKPELPQADVDALEDWILERDIIVAARPETDQEEMVVASTVRTELACSQLDLDALTTFREEWFETRPTE